MTRFVIGTTRYWASNPGNKVSAWWSERTNVHNGSIDWEFSGFSPMLMEATTFATRDEAESRAVEVAAHTPARIGTLSVETREEAEHEAFL